MAKATKAKTKTTAATKKVTKKPATVVKRVTPKKNTPKKAEQPPFFQIRITDQTVYWLIFGAAAILFAMWLYTLDARVRDLYDQVDANTSNFDAMIRPEADKATTEPAPEQ